MSSTVMLLTYKQTYAARHWNAMQCKANHMSNDWDAPGNLLLLPFPTFY